MVIAMTPGEVRRVNLPEDDRKPQEERALFHLVSLTYKESQELRKFNKHVMELREQIREAQRKVYTQIAEQRGMKLDELLEKIEKKEIDPAGIELSREEMRTLNRSAGASSLGVDLIYQPGFIEATLGEPGRPRGLVGWENLKNGKGQAVAFDKEKYLDYLPEKALVFLALQVFNHQFLTPADEKN